MGSVMTKLEVFKQVQSRWVWWFTKRGELERGWCDDKVEVFYQRCL